MTEEDKKRVELARLALGLDPHPEPEIDTGCACVFACGTRIPGTEDCPNLCSLKDTDTKH